ncbi:serine hydrolase domain-containing protein [Paenibacillus glufosinatiresistens]|uniref:serine hydrolase domain-containing protein n=1 Tax=Paenibacillus glufosinatiresistens TaxID=3070657 RepID=UPI00286E5C3C|nr:serine hydrolase [Paenibacillus sp. YX.27]
MKQPVPILQSPQRAVPFLPAARPEDTGTAPDPLEEAHRTVLREYGKMHSMLVARGGRLIFERYYGEGAPARLNDLRSATKSVTSLLVGIAAGRGDLPGIETPAAGILRRHVPYLHSEELPEITLRHLLTMTAGFSWQTGKRLGEPLIAKFHRARRWASFAMSLPIIREQIGTFQYRSTDSHLLSMALTECTGLDAFSYAREHLFGPLGIEHAAWNASPEGHSMGHIGLHLTSRDLIKLGICLLADGRYGQKQIVPAEWLKDALSAQTSGYPAYGDYGYQFWTGVMSGQPFTLAHGHGGQQILLLPRLDAVIVFTAESRTGHWKHPRKLVEQHLIPAMTGAASRS